MGRAFPFTDGDAFYSTCPNGQFVSPKHLRATVYTSPLFSLTDLVIVPVATPGPNVLVVILLSPANNTEEVRWIGLVIPKRSGRSLIAPCLRSLNTRHDMELCNATQVTVHKLLKTNGMLGVKITTIAKMFAATVTLRGVRCMMR